MWPAIAGAVSAMGGWGSLAGAAGSLFSGIMGGKSASSSDKIARQQLAMQQYMNDYAMQGMDSAQQRENEFINYLMGQNDWRMGQAQEEMLYGRNWAEQDLARQLQESDWSRGRIEMGDAYSMQERQRMLQEEAQYKDAIARERQQMLGYLDYNKNTAAGERAWEEQMLQADRRQSQDHSAWQRMQFDDTLRQLGVERDHELGRQGQIEGKAGQMGRMLQDALGNMGQMVDPRVYGEKDFLAAEAQFADQYMSDADRGADRLASINEARDIERGLDRSTAGESSRRAVLQEQINPLYADARNRAKQAALAHITGLQGVESKNQQDEMLRRNQRFSEIGAAMGPELEILANLRPAPTATSDSWAGIGDGILHRQLGSATNYDSPLGYVSGATRGQGLDIGMVNQFANPTQSYGTNAPNMRWSDVNLWQPIGQASQPGDYASLVSQGNPTAWAANSAAGANSAMQSFGQLADWVSGWDMDKLKSAFAR